VSSSLDADFDPGDTQSDANGSAKVALLLIEESRQAWRVLMEPGRAAANGVPARLIATLDAMESELLRHLVRNDGKIVSRKQILEEVWGLHEDTDTRAIDNFVVRLRRYLEDDPGHPQHLLTVRGVGYKFLANPNRE